MLQQQLIKTVEGWVQEQLQEKSKEELIELYMLLWKKYHQLPAGVRWINEGVNDTWELIMRNYQPLIGILSDVEYEPTSYIIQVISQEYDSVEDKTFKRFKEVKINAGMCFSIQRLYNEEEVEKK